MHGVQSWPAFCQSAFQRRHQPKRYRRGHHGNGAEDGNLPSDATVNGIELPVPDGSRHGDQPEQRQQAVGHQRHQDHPHGDSAAVAQPAADGVGADRPRRRLADEDGGVGAGHGVTERQGFDVEPAKQ